LESCTRSSAECPSSLWKGRLLDGLPFVLLPGSSPHQANLFESRDVLGLLSFIGFQKSFGGKAALEQFPDWDVTGCFAPQGIPDSV
jgi:hypothetical protein